MSENLSTAQNGSSKEFKPAAAILREMLADHSKTIVCPGVYDGFTARLALNAGFDCLYMTGAGTTASLLGSPDLALISLPEMATQARTIASLNHHVPLIADADTGFGGPLSVARTVSTYIQSNIAALHLEDQALTKRCGHLSGKELVSQDIFLTRIRAAAMARAESGRDIVLIARTDALQGQGFDEAVRRLKAAVACGADVAFLEGIETREQARRVTAELAPTPCLLNMVPGGVTPLVSAAEAREMGFRIVIWPILALSEVFNAVGGAMRELKESGWHTQKMEVDGEGKERVKGGVRECFEACGLSGCVEFDGKAGGGAYSAGV